MGVSEFTNLIIKDDEKRLVEGWASVEVVDRQGDIVPMDTIKEAFMDFVSRTGGLIMKQHENKPIGKVLQWNVEDYDKEVPGIKMVVEVFGKGVTADEAWNEVKSGTLSGFSIGGKALDREDRIDKESGKVIRILKKIELNEISIVKEPANQYSLIEAVSISKAKSKDLSDDANTIIQRKFDDSKEASEVETAAKGVELDSGSKEGVNKSMEAIVKFLKASYPFDECLRDQEKRYGSKEAAQKICGSIRSKYGKSLDQEWSESGINSDKNKSVPVSEDKEHIEDESEEEEDDVDKALNFVIMTKYYEPIAKSFLWDKCIQDQMDRYHDPTDAEQVCGAIRQKVMQRKGYGYSDHNSQRKSLDKANYNASGKTLPGDIATIRDTHIKQEDDDKVSENPIGKTVNINKPNYISRNMVNKGQLHSVGDKNMNEAVETESDGIESKVKEKSFGADQRKGELSTKIEEEEHAREERKKPQIPREEEEGEGEEKAEPEGEVESDGSSETNKLLQLLISKIDRLVQTKSALGDEVTDEAKSNYMDHSRSIEEDEPKGKSDGRRKGGVGIEQVPSGIEVDKSSKQIKKSGQSPAAAVDFGRTYVNGVKGVSNGNVDSGFEEILKDVYSGKKTARQIYFEGKYGRRE